MSEKNDWIRLLVKYKGKCAECGLEIPAGEYALWSRSSKIIKHIGCGTRIRSQAKKQAGDELYCFICGRPAGCNTCNYESSCNRAVVSQACICDSCLGEKDAYQKYQQAFLTKMRKVAKVKI